MATGDHNAFVRLRSKGPGGEWLAPPELRPKLVADAQDQNTNMTEIAIGILSRRYGVPTMPNGRRTHPKSADDIILLRIPQELAAAIGAAANAAVPRRTINDEIRAALCAHYGLRFVKVKRPRRARAAA